MDPVATSNRERPQFRTFLMWNRSTGSGVRDQGSGISKHETHEGAKHLRPVRMLTISARINRWLSPDHVIGQQLLNTRMRAQLFAWRPSSVEDAALKRIIATLAPSYTMVDLARLRQLAAHAELIYCDAVPGAVVECGTWRGGSLALLDWMLRRRGDARELWAFDSFEGLPKPGEREPFRARRGFFAGWCSATEDDVRRAVATAGGDPDRVHLVRGWIDETLSRTDTGPIALLNVDVDWYDSVRTALRLMFDRISPGGVVNVDDYGRWRGCDEAVHDFLRERGLPITLIRRTGRHGAWLRKP